MAPRWRLYGSWMEYDYPPRIRLIPLADNLNRLSDSAVTLAYSLALFLPLVSLIQNVSK